jgi:hypothetical protein
MTKIIFIPLGEYVHPYAHNRVLGLAVNVRASVIATSHYDTYDLHHVTHHRQTMQKRVDGQWVLTAQLHKSAKRDEGWIRVMKPNAARKRLPRF